MNDPRLPLQTGHGAERAILVAALLFAPGALLLPLYVLGLSAVEHVGLGRAETSIGVWVLGGFFAMLGGRWAKRAWLERPSDVRLAADSLELEGGLHAGFSLPFRDAAPEAWTLEVERGRTRLIMPVADELMILGSSMNADEGQSLGDLLDAIRETCASAMEEAAPAPVARIGVDVLICSGCGALLAPEVAPAIVCHRCGARAQVPPGLAERLAAARDIAVLSPANDRALKALLRQPTAAKVNRALLAVVVGIALSVAVTLLFAILATRANALHHGGALHLAIPLAVAIGLTSIARLALADRRAVHLVAMHASAIAPAAAGEPFTCRSCGGPLPAVRGAIAVGCLYCGAPNVLAVSLHKRAGAERSLQVDLAEALDERRRRRTLAWAGAAFGAVFTAIAVAAAVSLFA